MASLLLVKICWEVIPCKKLTVLVVEDARTARQHTLEVLEDAEHSLRGSSRHEGQQRRLRAFVNLFFMFSTHHRGVQRAHRVRMVSIGETMGSDRITTMTRLLRHKHMDPPTKFDKRRGRPSTW